MNIERIADRLAKEKAVISRPGLGPYLTRWTLAGERYGPPGSKAVFLHRFHRSDPDHVHDHPWPFTSVILWGGYSEHTPADPANPAGPTVRRWYGPGRVLRRPALWRHRIELAPGREAWTLIFRGAKERSWGFFCPAGYMDWRTYTNRLDAGHQNPCDGEGHE